jgi:hypothetical protein
MPVMGGLAATAPSAPSRAGRPAGDRDDGQCDGLRPRRVHRGGMDDHLAKPIVLSQVVAVILRHLRHRSAGRWRRTMPPPGCRAGARPRRRRRPAGWRRRAVRAAAAGVPRNLRQSRAELQAGLAHEDLCRLMHTLKSTAGAMGASTLAAAAQTGRDPPADRVARPCPAAWARWAKPSTTSWSNCRADARRGRRPDRLAQTPGASRLPTGLLGSVFSITAASGTSCGPSSSGRGGGCSRVVGRLRLGGLLGCGHGLAPVEHPASPRCQPLGVGRGLLPC